MHLFEDEPVVWWRHLQPSVFSMVLLLFCGNILSSPFCQGRCVYFKTPTAAICYIKGTGFTLRTTVQKMKFSIKDFFSKCDQIRRKLRIWSHLLKKFLMQNFIFCAANIWRVLHLFEEHNYSPYFFKVSFFFAELVAVFLIEGYCVMQPFFHDECVYLIRVNAYICCHADPCYC